jgi:hypothetical protein
LKGIIVWQSIDDLEPPFPVELQRLDIGLEAMEEDLLAEGTEHALSRAGLSLFCPSGSIPS